jgi:hypothetical protein
LRGLKRIFSGLAATFFDKKRIKSASGAETSDVRLKMEVMDGHGWLL